MRLGAGNAVQTDPVALRMRRRAREDACMNILRSAAAHPREGSFLRTGVEFNSSETAQTRHRTVKYRVM